jgi:hypothetical protein
MTEVPADFNATLDLVPIDYVADVVVDLLQRFETVEGSAFHVVGARPLTMRECNDVLAEYPPFMMPRFVPSASFDPSRLTSIERGYYKRVVRLYEPYLERHVIFSAERLSSVCSVRHSARGKGLLRTLLDHCVRTGYLGTPRTTIDAVLKTAKSNGRQGSQMLRHRGIKQIGDAHDGQ